MTDLNASLSKNFKLWEFVASPTAAKYGLKNIPDKRETENLRRLCEQILQPARDALGPLKINSGFRSAELNERVGGSRASDHRKGLAADVVPVAVGTRRLAEWVVKNCRDFDQVILEFGSINYPDWIHLSAAPRNRRQILQAAKKNNRTVYTEIALAPSAAAPTLTPARKFSASLTESVKWFNRKFGDKIESGLRGTPFSKDLAVAIALQETFYLWGQMSKNKDLSEADILKLCVGDTLDAPKRSAFPVNKANLLSVSGGREMFKIARKALENLAPYSAAYRAVAESNPDKFCRGFGIFQYDLQHYKSNSDFFLERRWSDFPQCLKMFVSELKKALKTAYGSDKTSLTEREMVFVAIAYNTGRVNFERGFKQGYQDADKRFYGEYIWEYLQLSKSIS